MLSPKARRNISRIIPFGLIWLMASTVYTLLERGILADLTRYPSTGNPYNFASSIFITPSAALITGLLIGAIEILFLNKMFIQMRFVQKILCKTLLYLALIVLFLLGVTALANTIELRTSFFNDRVWHNTWAFFSTYSFWSIELYIAMMICISLFYAEVSENIGQGVLNNFFAGKYHVPIEEERIFMFLDMKASTTIAENIGHLKYFRMLKQYFSDLSDSIINHSGEIYQYVGDEVVVSWTVSNGLQDNNCLQCFYSMKAAIQKQALWYREKFGIAPEFKAALHIGKVTTGEIGVIKKEIIFTGDVLNTTARIQGLCNGYGVDILISDQLMKRMDLSARFTITGLGESELRGRDEKIGLFTIRS